MLSPIELGDLSDLQGEFLHIVTQARIGGEEKKTPDDRRSIGSLADRRPSAEDLLCGRSGLSAEESASIYRGMYWARLENVLSNELPAFRAACGEEVFRRIVVDYMTARPSRHYSLDGIGDALPDFIEVHDDESLPHSRSLSDLARLEVAENRALRRPSAARMDPERLAAVHRSPHATMKLIAAESLSLVELTHDALVTLHAFRDRGVLEAPKPRATCVAVLRRGSQAVMLRETRETFDTLRRLSAGEPIAEALSAVRDLHPRSLKLAFERWIAHGIFCDFVMSPQE